MPGFASIEPSEVDLARTPVLAGVYRYQPEGNPVYQLLPNVRVLSIRWREGADPGVARFRYVFDTSAPPEYPSSFEQTLAVNGDLPGVVLDDERLVVMTFYPDGSPLLL